MSDDLISIQAAITNMNKVIMFRTNPEWKDRVAAYLKSLPSADNDSLYKKLNEAHNEGYDVGYWAGRRDYEQKWIPCSEKLPEPYQYVLRTVKRLYWDEGTGYTTCLDVDIGTYNTNDGNIVAWMPLPKPYERKES